MPTYIRIFFRRGGNVYSIHFPHDNNIFYYSSSSKCLSTYTRVTNAHTTPAGIRKVVC